MKEIFRLGTRGSPLALAQTREVEDALRRAWPDMAVEVVVIRTTGDKTQQQNLSLADRGGKGLFMKEIEDALIDGAIDAGVHSAKDMPTHLPTGLKIGCVLPRGDARDVFFARDGHTLETLPPGSVVGTASPRRQALVLAARPDLKVTLLRGNVGTRLAKLAAGDVDATLLAAVGLDRLGESARIQTYLDPQVIVPAAGQGAIALEIRSGDAKATAAIAAIHCVQSGDILAAERAVVAALNGSCNSPIAAWGRLDSGQFTIDALAARLDGSVIHRVQLKGDPGQILAVGRDAGRQLKEALPPYFFPG